MRIVPTVAELRAQIAEWRRAGDVVGMVPTMGNLHAGHVSLVGRARQPQADGRVPRVVVSVFVNPLQFGPGEDFDRYPRTLAADAEKVATAGADLVFAPSVDEVYPLGYPPYTQVQVGGPITEVLEGAFRPGHFAGVATVVNILFNLVQPDFAVFGQKDWQQLAVIRRMVGELGMPIEIIAAPTVREADGLAMSSRNQYLDAEQRSHAAALNRALNAVADGLRAGRRDFAALVAESADALAIAGYRVQYLEVRAPDLSAPAANLRRYSVLAAAYLGHTRLIDNLDVEVDSAV